MLSPCLNTSESPHVRIHIDLTCANLQESYISTLTKSQDSLALGFQQADTAFASFLDKISLVQGRGMQAVAASGMIPV